MSIKNPSRVMGLAGAWHVKSGSEPLRCQLISQEQERKRQRERSQQTLTKLPGLEID